ncbi:MAG: flagellar hook protein FlgE [Lachnospiraceae bacterium]|nr:flagellar hook protein FlgE [Lachnospiraceae bacterium]
MMRSLYSGVAGLKTHQTRMDVIGNNIANVNTVGFKGSNVQFMDVLYQTSQRATGSNPANGAGGTNAKQIGLGITTASITKQLSGTGSAETTNNPYDLMLNSDSFFIVSRGNMNYFTKVGAFQMDGAGYLVTGTGELVMGWQVDPDDPTQIRKDTVSALQVESPENQYSEPQATTAAYVSGNIDKTDAVFEDGGAKIMNVTIYDEKGYGYNVKMNVRQNNTADQNTYTVSIESITDSNNVPITAGYQLSGDQLVFDPDTGAFQSIGGGDAITLTINDDAFKPISIDFSTSTMYATSASSTIKLNKGDLKGLGGGRKVGKLDEVSINTDGKIYGVYDNGEEKLLGQIAVAKFANPAGLEAIGNSMYQTTQNSGDFDGIGQEVTEGGGTMSQGVIEMSDVDLSTEFTDMIVTQRGFQANSRIITTSDTMLEELINLKR